MRRIQVRNYQGDGTIRTLEAAAPYSDRFSIDFEAFDMSQPFHQRYSLGSIPSPNVLLCVMVRFKGQPYGGRESQDAAKIGMRLVGRSGGVYVDLDSEIKNLILSEHGPSFENPQDGKLYGLYGEGSRKSTIHKAEAPAEPCTLDVTWTPGANAPKQSGWFCLESD